MRTIVHLGKPSDCLFNITVIGESRSRLNGSTVDFPDESEEEPRTGGNWTEFF